MSRIKGAQGTYVNKRLEPPTWNATWVGGSFNFIEKDKVIMTTFVEERIKNRAYEGFDYTDPAFIRQLFEDSDEHLHLPKDKYAICLINAPYLTLEELDKVLSSNTDENYKDAVLRNYTTRDSEYPPVLAQALINSSYGTPGAIKSHILDVTIAGGTMAIELPAIQVYPVTKSFEARIKNAQKKTIEKTLWQTLCYVYRLGLDDKNVLTEAVKRGVKYEVIRRIQDRAVKSSFNTKTLAETFLIGWFEEAVKSCNSWDQVDILIHLYIEAVTYNTTQPVVSKSRIADKVGIDRKVIRRLFDRLDKAGMLKEGEVTFKSKHGYVKNARVVNLNPLEPTRIVT